jgi:hypothetical protein
MYLPGESVKYPETLFMASAYLRQLENEFWMQPRIKEAL